MELFELLMASSAVGFTSAYLMNKFKEKRAEQGGKMDERPLSGVARKRVDALNELVASGRDIALSSPSIKVQVTGKMEGYFYAFYYQHLQTPFVTFLYDSTTQSIVNMYVAVLNTNHKEVKTTLEKIKNKVIEKHTGKSVLLASIPSIDEVKPKYNELMTRVKALQTHAEISTSDQTLLSDSIEPLLQDVMVKFTALNVAEKEVFISKALDIFYAVEKTIKSIEQVAEKKKKETLAHYFIEMEKQAEELTEGK